MGTTLEKPSGFIASVGRTTCDTAVSATVIGFGTSAAITIAFNTLLAWVKDAFDPLNTFMAYLTGNHWITHGLVDVVLFFVLGAVLTVARHGRSGDGIRLVLMLLVSTLVAGAGLSVWFLIV
jgi:multisubunit Na+/H+ antiporter MnhB subunit